MVQDHNGQSSNLCSPTMQDVAVTRCSHKAFAVGSTPALATIDIYTRYDVIPNNIMTNIPDMV